MPIRVEPVLDVGLCVSTGLSTVALSEQFGNYPGLKKVVLVHSPSQKVNLAIRELPHFSLGVLGAKFIIEKEAERNRQKSRPLAQAVIYLKDPASSFCLKFACAHDTYYNCSEYTLI